MGLEQGDEKTYSRFDQLFEPGALRGFIERRPEFDWHRAGPKGMCVTWASLPPPPAATNMPGSASNMLALSDDSATSMHDRILLSCPQGTGHMWYGGSRQKKYRVEYKETAGCGFVELAAGCEPTNEQFIAIIVITNVIFYIFWDVCTVCGF